MNIQEEHYLPLAIADVIRHEKLGLCAYSPDMEEEPPEDSIRVYDLKKNFHFVFVFECERATKKETDCFWKIINKQQTRYTFMQEE